MVLVLLPVSISFSGIQVMGLTGDSRVARVNWRQLLQVESEHLIQAHTNNVQLIRLVVGY